MKKSSFILHCDSLEIESELSDEELGKLFRAIIKIQEGEIIELPKHLKLVFSFFKNQFKRDIESYDKIVERNKTNGAKGGRPKKSKPKKPSGLSGNPKNPSEPKKAYSDSDKESDSKNDITQDLDKILLHWNSFKNRDKEWKGSRIVTDELKKAYIQIKGKQTSSEFGENWNYGIDKYLEEIEGRTGDYTKHRFTLTEFMKQKNGYLKFLNIT